MPKKKKVLAIKICSTPDCEGEVKALGKCASCHARMYYWNDRPLADKMNHRKKLIMRAHTMDEMMGVTTINKRSSRRTA